MSRRLPVFVALVSLLLGAGCDSVLDSVGIGPGGGKGGGGNGKDGLPACKKVDLVISVDDSESMQEEKDAMRNVIFPAMAQRLLTISEGLDDFRVAVMDACPDPASFHTRGRGGECDFSSQELWMEHDSPNLVNEFACVGDIYSGDNSCSGNNDDEQPANTIAVGLAGPMAGVGFLRDDALLVAIAITDEDEQPLPDASAEEVYDSLVAVKGNVNKMVFLGIGGAQDCQGVYGKAENAEKLKDITALFEAQGQGMFWDLCDGNLEDGLEQVMSTIESACDDFCNDPDGCDRYPPPDDNPPDGDECVVDSDCPTGEFCEEGYCQPQIL